ncbi:MAG: carbohydrate binding family 9 domain-containing protein [Sandaracinaceae bacterium]|nr:carbohydrate binding family 9 domain-containing protein [Sandaracinaceae bacterium]
MRWVSTLCLLSLLPSAAEAQERPLLAARARRGAIRIDGVLDEPDWARADAGSDFVERIPSPGARPPVDTEVRVLVDEGAVYVGVTSFLAEGETPRALELTRDSSRIWSDDAVTIKFDVRRDRRSTVGFAVNPAGAQIDFVALDNGRTFRREYDAVWESATSVREDAWVAEFRIPAAALRLPPGEDERVFGFNVSRDHNARQATYDWSHLPPEFGAASALHYGDLDHVAGLGGGRSLIVNPYFLVTWPGHDDWGLPVEPKAGGEMRLRLADDVWGELTLLTDFAEVDLDSQVVNLDRFPLFFPERRPFFLSGLDVFEFGALEEAQLFFTRRIGLDDDANPVPILGGLKVYGREGFLSFGVLDVATAATADREAANYGVARVRANFGTASYVGAMYASRADIAGPGGLFSQVDARPHHTVGVDGLVRALDGDRLEIRGFGAFAATDGEEPTEGLAGRLEVQWRGEQWMPRASALYIQEGFDPELGFVRRPALFQAGLAVPVTLRTPTRGVRQMVYGLSGEIAYSDDFEQLLRVAGGWQASIQTADLWTLGANADYVQDVVREEFELLDGLTIPVGPYRGARVQVGLWSPDARNPGLGAVVTAENAFFGGANYRLNLDVSAAFGQHVRGSVGAVGALLDFPDRELIPTLAINSVLSVTPSPWVVVDLVAQVNTVTERFIGMGRLRWRYLPGSDLFLVYRAEVVYSDAEATLDQRVTLKVSYRYDAVL